MASSDVNVPKGNAISVALIVLGVVGLAAIGLVIWGLSQPASLGIEGEQTRTNSFTSWVTNIFDLTALFGSLGASKGTSGGAWA